MVLLARERVWVKAKGRGNMEITVHDMLECLTQWTPDLYNMDTDNVPKERAYKGGNLHDVYTP